MILKKDTIGIGFIGAGDISILHARAVQKCHEAKLVGLSSLFRSSSVLLQVLLGI